MDQNKVFDTLWDMWPNKVKKAEARKAFQEMQSHGRLPPPEDLLAAAEKYAAATKGRYKKQICQLSSWLRGERFEDDLNVEIYKPHYDQNGQTLAQLVKGYWLGQGNQSKYQSDNGHNYPNRGQIIGDGLDARSNPVNPDDGAKGNS